MYSSTSGHVSTCVYMGQRLKESFVSKQQSKQYTCPWCTIGGKVSDKNLEQRINFKFCVKIAKRASKTLVLLTLA
jgi:hypothetical protein